MNVYGLNNTVHGGTGNDTVNLFSYGDTVGSSAGSDLIHMIGGGATFEAGHNGYADTVVGFLEGSDTIALTGGDNAGDLVATQQQQNGGQDTLIALSDGSTILLKGIAHVDQGFFS